VLPWAVRSATLGLRATAAEPPNRDRQPPIT
jgi:hypothetical protein